MDIIDKEQIRTEMLKSFILITERHLKSKLNVIGILDKDILAGCVVFNKKEIKRLEVLSRYRNRGYGKVLVNMALKSMSNKVYVESTKSAIRFYESLGFRIKSQNYAKTWMILKNNRSGIKQGEN